jgi:hypothetical protein
MKGNEKVTFAGDDCLQKCWKYDLKGKAGPRKYIEMHNISWTGHEMR